MFINLEYLLAIVGVSIVINTLTIYLSNSLGFGIDRIYSGGHKIHKKSVPRLGGIGIYAPFIVTFLFFMKNKLVDRHFMLLATFPFIIGLMEDIYQNTSANFRFSLIALISFLSIFLINENTILTDIGFKIPFYVAAPFTVFAITGVTNSINIIDGLNGLSSGISLTAILFMAILAHQLNYPDIFNSLFLLASSTLGFFVINFFTGRIFLGDSGAYFIGFALSLYSAIFANRGNGMVSPWFFVVLMAYPIFDTIFSMYRRKFIRGVSTFSADSMHMHTLLYRRVFRRQYKATVFILLVNGLFSYTAYSLRESTTLLICLFAIFCALYLIGYKAILSFKIKVKL